MLRMLISMWLVPPAINILIILFGLLLVRWFRKSGMVISVFGLLSLWLLSTLWFSSLLASSIERYPAIQPDTIVQNDSQAIVVLGSSQLDAAEEYGRTTPDDSALVRLHYAANIHRRSGLPVMLTGGPMNKMQDIHAQVLAESLKSQFGIKAQWLEGKSATTWQNALYSAEVLHPQNVKNIVLVTHSYHMARSVMLFELAGFTVLPAPTQLSTAYPLDDWRYWMPEIKGLQLSASVIHEYLGLLWYQLVSPVKSSFEQQYSLPVR